MNQPAEDLRGYAWEDAHLTCAHEYLLPELEEVLTRAAADTGTSVSDD